MMADTEVDSRRCEMATGLRRMERTRTYSVRNDGTGLLECLLPEYSSIIKPQAVRID
jgi:hypothetical protein